MVSQLIRSFSREVASWMIGALCPRISPAVTTAITPEACSSSAGRYARNGAINETAVSMIGSLMCLRISAISEGDRDADRGATRCRPDEVQGDAADADHGGQRDDRGAQRDQRGGVIQQRLPLQHGDDPAG